MRTTLTALSILLAGCTTFPLGTARGLNGQNQTVASFDSGVCERKARDGNLFSDHYVQIKAWRECMTDKGYIVTPP